MKLLLVQHGFVVIIIYDSNNNNNNNNNDIMVVLGFYGAFKEFSMRFQ